MEPFKISGSRTDIGFAHGEEFQKEIHTLLEQRTDILLTQNSLIRKSDIDQICIKSLCYFKNTLPELYEEVSAIAKSSGVAIHELVICGGYTDLLDVILGNTDDYSECTTLVDSSNILIAGTWDSHATAEDALIVLDREIREENLQVLSLTTAGWPALQGVNNRGIAFAINNLMPKTADIDGLNFIVANSALSETNSIDEFTSFCTTNKFCSGHAYTLLDSNGNGAVIETTHNNISVNKFNSGFKVQANHYKTEWLDDNSNYPHLTGSIDREEEMTRIGSLLKNPEAFFNEILLSQFINKRNLDSTTLTCSSYILMPEQKKIIYRYSSSKSKDLLYASLP